MISLYKKIEETKRIKRLDNELFFNADGEAVPFAFRCADTNELYERNAGGNRLFEIGAFSLYENAGNLCCIYRGVRELIAYISPLDGEKLKVQTAEKLERYFLNAYLLDPYAISEMAAFEKFEKLVSDAADFCGCLTDIIRENNEAYAIPQYAAKFENRGCAHIALSLPIISLMFRRISALRGFNFKVMVKESLPCLIFSAKVLFPNKETPPDISSIREYSVLTDILGGDGLIIGSRLKEVDECDEADEAIYRLSVAICPQVFDPRGILRAPAWKRHAETIIDGLDIDLDGKY